MVSKGNLSEIMEVRRMGKKEVHEDVVTLYNPTVRLVVSYLM